MYYYHCFAWSWLYGTYNWWESMKIIFFSHDLISYFKYQLKVMITCDSWDWSHGFQQKVDEWSKPVPEKNLNQRIFVVVLQEYCVFPVLKQSKYPQLLEWIKDLILLFLDQFQVPQPNLSFITYFLFDKFFFKKFFNIPNWSLFYTLCLLLVNILLVFLVKSLGFIPCHRKYWLFFQL